MRKAASVMLFAWALACHHSPDLALFPAPCLRTRMCTAPAQGIDSTLPAGTLRALVLDSADAKPIQAQVGLNSWHQQNFIWSNKAGKVRLNALPPGPDTLVVRLIGYHTRRIPINVGVRGTWAVIPLGPASCVSQADVIFCH